MFHLISYLKKVKNDNALWIVRMKRLYKIIAKTFPKCNFALVKANSFNTFLKVLSKVWFSNRITVFSLKLKNHSEKLSNKIFFRWKNSCKQKKTRAAEKRFHSLLFWYLTISFSPFCVVVCVNKLLLICQPTFSFAFSKS